MGANNKLREALASLIDGICFHCDLSEDCKGAPCEKIQKAKAALSDPLRNCEVGTAEEQAKRMDDFCARHGERIGCSWRCDNCPLCSIDRCELAWAQMPYEEGDVR